MKKIKKLHTIFGILLLFIVCTILPTHAVARVVPNEDGYWKYDVSGFRTKYVQLEDSKLYMNLGPEYDVHHNSLSPASFVAYSHPNVFIMSDSNSHIFTSNDYKSSVMKYPATNFLIAEKNENDPTGYTVMSDPLYINAAASTGYYLNEGKNSIYAESTNYFMPVSDAQMTIGLEMVPLSNSLIRHTYTVENTSDQAVTFIAMRNLTVEINEKISQYSYVENNPKPVDMKMLGLNEGISTENRGYRVNYLFRNTPNGPENFSSFAVPKGYTTEINSYFHKGKDKNHYPNAPWIYNPYSNNSIHGTGMEADNYQPNQILKPNSYSNKDRNGIAMKWDEVTLEPGEYKDFSYDVQMYGDFGITYLFHNKDESKEQHFNPGDTVVLQPSGNWNNEDYKLDEGVISTTISEGITLRPNDEVLVKSTSTSGDGLDIKEIKRVKVKEVYDKNERILSVPILKEEVANIDPKTNGVGLEFNGLLNEKSANRVLTQEGTVTFKDGKTAKEYERNQPIFITVDDGEFVDSPSYELEVEKTVEKDSYFVGDTVTYQLKAQNLEESTDELNEAKLVDTLPNGLGKPMNIKINNQNVAEQKVAWNDKTRELVINLNEMVPGEVATVTYETKLEAGEADEIKTNYVTFSAEEVEDEATSQADFIVKEKVKRTVTFDSLGGSQVESIIVNDGDSVAPPKDPSYKNRVFKGWYTTKELKNKYDFNQPVTKNLTLYAKWQSNILDPENSNDSVEPSKPANDFENDLRIAYVSNFEFGVQENNKNAFTKLSKYDVVKKDKDKKVPSFVSIIDDRPDGLEKTPWELRVKSSPFVNKEGKELKNASLILSDLNYDGNRKNPTIYPGSMNISESVQRLSSSDNHPEGNSWSLSLGHLDEDEVTGVSLIVPFGEYKSATEYQAEINWELVPKISESGGNE